MQVFRALLLILLFTSGLTLAAADVPPVRQGVDIYNAVGSNQRLVGFMKIGASDKDLRYLSFLSARISQRPLLRAFLAGNLIYFKGLDQPLKIIDLKEKMFSFNGRRIDLKEKTSIEARMASLEKIVYPRRSAFILWDWVFPYAFAASNDPAALATLSGILAAGGVTSGAQCLAGAGTEAKNCVNEFMGTLAAVGAVGGLRGQDPASKVFCSPDFRGGQKFVIAGQTRNLLAVSEAHGEYEIRPANLNSGSPSSNKAAGALLASCRSAGALANLNIALAYPNTLPNAIPPATALATAMPTVTPVTTIAAPTTTRAPPSVREATEQWPEREQGGTAR